MKFINSNLKYTLFLIFPTLLFFTGCSQKSYDVDYDSFYRDTKNSKINNSREMHKYTMRPYTVFGIKYYPFVAKIGDEFEGIASWYGPDFHSKKTSNGETYNMYDMTAAHKTLPMNTVVRVDNKENGRSIIVRINDRGPFVTGRIIDLSNKAAHEIDMYRKGTAKVKITVLGYNGEIENKDAPFMEQSNDNLSTMTKSEKIEALEPLEIKEDKIRDVKPVVNSKPLTTSTSKVLSSGNFSVQVGAFSQEEGALKVKNDLQKKFTNNKVDVKKVLSNGKTLFKVFVGGFANQEKAQIFKETSGFSNAIISGN